MRRERGEGERGKDEGKQGGDGRQKCKEDAKAVGRRKGRGE